MTKIVPSINPAKWVFCNLIYKVYFDDELLFPKTFNISYNNNVTITRVDCAYSIHCIIFHFRPAALKMIKEPL